MICIDVCLKPVGIFIMKKKIETFTSEIKKVSKNNIFKQIYSMILLYTCELISIEVVITR